MALTPPTVASDPASAAHTNTALAAVNTLITSTGTKVNAIFAVIRDRARLCGGNNAILSSIDSLGGAIAAAANPTVAADPATQSQTNTALALLGTYIDTLNTAANNLFSAVGANIKRNGGRHVVFERFNADAANLISPAALTAVTVASDPVSQAHMNTALASVVAYIDTLASEVQVAARYFINEFALNPGNQILNDRLAGSINALD